MPRDEAVKLVKQHLPNKNLRKHVYAVEAIMRGIAIKFGEDEEAWGLAGLLHDLDYEATKDSLEEHTKQTQALLEERGDVNAEILQAIEAHVGFIPRESLMDKAIYCADPTSGFLVACALMHPSKKLDQLDYQFIARRFKEKRFAAGADRDQMKACSELNMELEEFMMLSLEAMIGISGELGL